MDVTKEKQEVMSTTVPPVMAEIGKDPLSSLQSAYHTQEGAVLVIGGDVLGRGDDTLGALLMKNFFFTLTQGEDAPKTIILLNSGVKLAAEGSSVLEALWSLEGKGCEILSCGTCLDFYQLKEKVAAGKVSNMYTILETINRAFKVINL